MADSPYGDYVVSNLLQPPPPPPPGGLAVTKTWSFTLEAFEPPDEEEEERKRLEAEAEAAAKAAEEAAKEAAKKVEPKPEDEPKLEEPKPKDDEPRPKPENEAKPAVPAATPETPKKKEKAPLKEIAKLEGPALDKVFARMPAAMQSRQEDPAPTFAFKEASDTLKSYDRSNVHRKKQFPVPKVTPGDIAFKERMDEIQKKEAAKRKAEEERQVKERKEAEEKAKKAEEDAAKAAKKAEEDAVKAAKKAEEDAAKAAKKAEEKAKKDAEEAAEREIKEAEKAKKAMEKAQKEAAERQRKEAERRQKEEEDAREQARKAAEIEAEQLRFLRLQRYEPQHNQDNVKFEIKLTFNHPLVASDYDPAKDGLNWTPKVTPSPPKGTWSVSKDTPNVLRFALDAGQLWANSTEYTLKIESGVLSANNHPIDEEHVIKFSTPYMKATKLWPDTAPIALNPIFLWKFSQFVDPKKVLACVALTNHGKEKPLGELKLVKSSEVKDYAKSIRRDNKLLELIDSVEEGKWIAFKPAFELPSEGHIDIVMKEVKSEEGPLAMDTSIYQFRVRPTFQATSVNFTNYTIKIGFSEAIVAKHTTEDKLPFKPVFKPEAPAGAWHATDNWLTYTPNVVNSWKLSTQFVVMIAPNAATSMEGDSLTWNPNLEYHHSVVTKENSKKDWTPGPYDEPFRWGFKTTPNSISAVFPRVNSTLRLNPVIRVELTQDIEPAALAKLATLYVKGRGLASKLGSLLVSDKPYCDLHSVTWEEAQKDPWLTEQTAYSDPSDFNPTARFAFLRPSKTLPPNVDVEFALGPDIPSKFGELLSSQKFTTKWETTVDWVPSIVGWESSLKAAPDSANFVLKLNFTQPLLHPNELKLHTKLDLFGSQHDTAVADRLSWKPIVTPDLPPGQWHFYESPNFLIYLSSSSAKLSNSTTYTVTFPTNATDSRDASPNVDSEGLKIATPIIQVANYSTETHYPGEIITAPIFFVGFSQFVKASDVLKVISFKVKGEKKPVAAIAVKADQAKKDKRIEPLIQKASEGKWFCFEPETPLPYQTEVELLIGPNIPSAEGPVVSTNQVKFGFETVKPFKVEVFKTRSPANVQPQPREELQVHMNYPIAVSAAGLPDWEPEIQPKPPGSAKWVVVSPRILTYTPTADWPKSTEYKISVPKGQLNSQGEETVEDFEGTFATPTVAVESVFPDHTELVPRKLAIYLLFDQKVDANAIAKVVTLKSQKINKGDKVVDYQLQVVPEKVVKKRDPRIKKLITTAPAGRWVVLEHPEFLPESTHFELTIGPNIPSAEGPLVSPFQKTIKMRTMPAMRANLSPNSGELKESNCKLAVVFTQAIFQENQSLSDLGWRPLIEKLDWDESFKPLKKQIEWKRVRDNAIETEVIQWKRSTSYKIKIPDTAMSIWGEKVTSTSVSFSTPTPKLVEFYPRPKMHASTGTVPAIFLRFDQKVDKNKLLATIHFYLNRSGANSLVKLISGEKKLYANARYFEGTPNHPKLKALMQKHKDVADTWVLVESVKAFAHDTAARIEVGPKVASSEGPYVNDQVYSLNFQTVKSLAVHVHQDRTGVRLVFNQKMFWGARVHRPSWAVVKDSNPPPAIGWQPFLEPALPSFLNPRWVVTNGTTVQLNLSGPFPRSSRYMLTIPALFAQSLSGEHLSQPFSHQIETDTVAVSKIIPAGGVVSPYATFAVLFNQFVEPAEVLPCVQVLVNKKPYPIELRLVSTKVALKRLPELIESANRSFEGKWLLFETSQLLPPETSFQIKIGPNIPSKEGPVRSPFSAVHSYSTPPGFEIQPLTRNSFGASGTFQIRFTNPHPYGNATGEFFKQFLAFTPSVKSFTIGPSYNSLSVAFESFMWNEPTTLKCEVSDLIEDRYGQNLAEHYSDAKENQNKRTLQLELRPSHFSASLRPQVSGSKYPIAHVGHRSVMMDPFLYEKKADESPLQLWMRQVKFLLHTYNYTEVRVCYYRLDPLADYTKWGTEGRAKDDNDEVALLEYGTKLADQIVRVPEFKPMEEKELYVDLRAAFENAEEAPYIGQIGFVAIPTKKAHYPNTYNREIVKEWLQFTRLGVEVFQSSHELVCWVTDIVTGAPVERAIVTATYASPSDCKEFKGQWPTGKTNAEGVARLAIPEDKQQQWRVVVSKKKDACWISDVTVVRDAAILKQMIWHVFDDRSIYRPKEVVNVKGYVRVFVTEKDGAGVAVSVPAPEKEPQPVEISYSLRDGNGAYAASGTTVMNGFGAFDFQLVLPETMNLGECELSLYMDSNKVKAEAFTTHTHKFQVQEFRRPEFVAKAAQLDEKERVYYQDAPVVKADASYYSGGGLPDCELTWSVASKLGHFIPPGWSRYTFATGTRKFADKGDEVINAVYSQNLKGVTSEKGKHHVKIQLQGLPQPPAPITLDVDLEVIDINKQALQAKTSLTVHPALYYVGLALPQGNVLNPDKQYFVDIVVTNVDGKLVGEVPVSVSIGAKNSSKPVAWNEKNWESIDSVTTSSASGPVQAKVEYNKDKQWTQYVFTACVVDPSGRTNLATIEFTAKAPRPDVQPPPPNKFDDLRKKRAPPKPSEVPEFVFVEPQTNVSVSTRAKDIRVGQTISFNVTTPFTSSRGLVSVFAAAAIVDTQTFAFADQSSTFELEIKPEYAPNAKIRVDVVGGTTRSSDETKKIEVKELDVPRPGIASGSMEIEVWATQDELKIVVAPQEDILEPGGQTTINVQVTDWKGKPVTSGEVAIIAIDESVLAITGYNVESPLKTFHPKRIFADLKQFSLRSKVLYKPITPKDEEKPLSVVPKAPEPVKPVPAQNARKVESLAKPNMALRSMPQQSAPAPPPPAMCAAGGGSPSNGPPPPSAFFSDSNASSALLMDLISASESRLMARDKMESEALNFQEEAEDRMESKKMAAPKSKSMAPRKKKMMKKEERERKSSKKDSDSKSSLYRSSAASMAAPMGKGDVAEEKKKSYDDAELAEAWGASESDGSEDDAADLDMDLGSSPADAPEHKEEEEEEPEPLDILMRADFNPLALFSPSVALGKDGEASIPIKIPDNLTRYRIWAVAAGRDSFLQKFGLGEGTITAQLPLVLRSTPPRFLNYGDSAEMPLIIQNLREIPLQVQIGVRALNASLGYERVERVGFDVEIPPESRRMVPIIINAKRPGEATFLVSVVSRAFGDAQEIKIPVLPPPAVESFSDDGSLAEKPTVKLSVSLPDDAIRDFGQLEISYASTAMQNMADCLTYLAEYQFNCNEQISSKTMATVSYAHVIKEFSFYFWQKKDLNKLVTKHMKEVKERQTSNGGFGMWNKTDRPQRFVSAHVANCVAVCKANGHDVDEGLLTKIFSKSWVAKLEDFLEAQISSKYVDDWINTTTGAYEIYALYKLRKNNKTIAMAEDFLRSRVLSALSVEALSMLLSVLSAPLGGDKSPLAASVVENLETLLPSFQTGEEKLITFQNSYYPRLAESDIFYTSDRPASLLLEAMVNAKPESNWVKILFKSVNKSKVNGRWTNTQSNCWAAMALDRYFKVMEKQEPKFSAHAWLDEGYVGNERFEGRSTATITTVVPIQYVLRSAAEMNAKQAAVSTEPTNLKELTIFKEGKGRLYWRLALKYAPKDLLLPPKSKGFTVTRTYAAASDADKENVKFEEEVWKIKKGTTVKVTITLKPLFDSHNIALVDYLPAGAEAINPEMTRLAAKKHQEAERKRLEALGQKPQPVAKSADNSKHDDRQYVGEPASDKPSEWFQHENYRDSRIEVFAAQVQENSPYTYTYEFRAVFAGSYMTPPTSAEEMYQPGIMGSSESLRVEIVN